MVNSREQEVMENGQERSKPLHNFTLPCSLKWGNQKHLRCKKVDDDDDHQQHQHQQRQQRQRRSPPSKLVINNNNNNNNSGSIITTRRQLKMLKEVQNEDVEEEEEEEGIEAVREKIMMDLKTAADKMKESILMSEEEEIRPWNLRTRRAACKAPIGGPSNKPNKPTSSSFSPMRTEKQPEMKERPKFAVALKKKEIEEDFMQMLGQKPPRRPKKRPKNVQRQMDLLFPGYWLSEVSADSYKVEVPEDGKK